MEPMLDPRVLDNHELDAELAVLRRGRDQSMDEGADDAALAEADRLIAAFENEIESMRKAAADPEI
ncbi:hypothetical protein RhoFasB10_00658 [Rhodococcus sp. B10]|nr:hypothetical protein [Rhodococcus sp. B10]